MQVVNRLYARHHNRRYQFTGHCFDGPYQAYPQPSPLLLLRTVSYVFLNPVDAGLSPTPEDYPWSCYRSYSDGQRDGLLEVNPAGLMAHVSDDPKTAWQLFRRAMEREARRPKFRSPAKLTMVQVHGQHFEWLLEHARERAASLGGEHPDLVAMYWGSEYRVSSRAMARVLEIRDPADVSRRTYRFKKRLERDPMLRDRMKPP